MAMQMMGMAKEFMMKVKLLFQDAKATICFIGGISRTFKIERGVKQGCPLAPASSSLQEKYLNFIWLKKWFKVATSRGLLCRMEESSNISHTSDTTITVKGLEEEDLCTVVNLLEQFVLINGLKINWDKSMA